MSRFLWGFGELAKDPAPQLLQSIEQHILGQRLEKSKNTAIDKNTEQQNNSTNDKNTTDICTQINIKTLSTSSQCSKCDIKCFDKIINTDILTYKDKYVDVLVKPVSVEDKMTAPNKEKLCSEHLAVFLMLKRWPNLDKIQNRQNYLSTIRTLCLQVLNFLSIKKIQNISNNLPQEQNAKLYRISSFTELTA